MPWLPIIVAIVSSPLEKKRNGGSARDEHCPAASHNLCIKKDI